jgi:hypothetical protein
MSALHAGPRPCTQAPGRRASLAVLLFGPLQALRMTAYLPTLWAIHASGSSTQYAAWTWLAFFCANLSMALSLLRRGTGRVDRYVLVNLINALMSLAVFALIVAYRP